MSSGTSILKSIIQAINPKHNACYVHPSRWRTTTTLVGTSSGLKALIRNVFIGYTTGVPSDLVASIIGEIGVVHSKDLLVALRASFIGDGDLLACIRCFVPKQANVEGHLVGWKRKAPVDLSSSIATIESQDIIVAIRAWREEKDQFKAIIRGWYPDNRFLGAAPNNPCG